MVVLVWHGGVPGGQHNFLGNSAGAPQQVALRSQEKQNERQAEVDGVALLRRTTQCQTEDIRGPQLNECTRRLLPLPVLCAVPV